MDELNQVSRRSFLKQLSSVAVLLPTIAAPTFLGCNRENALAADDNKNPPWKTTIVTDKEPGDPLIISGTIYGLDGKTRWKERYSGSIRPTLQESTLLLQAAGTIALRVFTGR